jgi:hypothetical protein
MDINLLGKNSVLKEKISKPYIDNIKVERKRV